MCGIVGILGRQPVADLLVDSLKRREYRGYDSAGVATLEGSHIERRRAEGKLKNLEARLKASPLLGHAGIGRTRSPATRARWFTTALSRISVSYAPSWNAPARSSTARPTPRSSRIW